MGSAYRYKQYVVTFKIPEHHNPTYDPISEDIRELLEGEYERQADHVSVVLYSTMGKTNKENS